MKSKILKLQQFLPYRLTKLSGKVSRNLANKYSTQFNLSIHEWRIIAILGEKPGLTAREVSELASLDKVNISRAIEKLEKAERIERKVMPNDRRSFSLHLTDKGQQVLQEIIPLALQFEANLLSVLSEEELKSLQAILTKLDKSAAILAKDK